MSDERKRNNDGGPAFPAEGGYASGLHPAPGMSLRDYFAAAALTAIAHKFVDEAGVDPDAVATDAYSLADAMLAERAKRGGADERALLAAHAAGRAEALEEAADAIERRAGGPCDDSRAIRTLATKEHA